MASGYDSPSRTGYLNSSTPSSNHKNASVAPPSHVDDIEIHESLEEAERVLDDLNTPVDRLPTEILSEIFLLVVEEFSMHLGFAPPSYEILAADGAFVTMAARFSPENARAEPRLAGHVGRVEHIFGKITARLGCAQKVLHVLKAIDDERKKGSGGR